nr:MAG TPA: hypothetical protein [Caudoviricetes sp.]
MLGYFGSCSVRIRNATYSGAKLNVHPSEVRVSKITVLRDRC